MGRLGDVGQRGEKGMRLRLFIFGAVMASALAASHVGSASGTARDSMALRASTVVVPNVVGLRMDTSTRLLHARGLRVNEECPKALFGCVIKANWWICRQYPRAGARVPRYSTIITYGVRHRGEGC